MDRNLSSAHGASAVADVTLTQPPQHTYPDRGAQLSKRQGEEHASSTPETTDFRISDSTLRKLLFALFALSGFSGLIYESIWTHYLKLFLGHAAYAQTLVLMLFMGGMAGGSWLAARFSPRWRNLLALYAVTEGVIGVLAFVFHALFTTTTAFAYSHLLPTFDSPFAASLVKWGLASALILPQCILLGMTFPLMSGGLLRRLPQQSGAIIAMLYFTNSLGAAVGVLVSGFALIDMVGLPGTILVAGVLNVVLALVMWLLAKGEDSAPYQHTAKAERHGVTASAVPSHVLLVVALITGASSFMYEIGWIRMLGLVLGSSTHSFEIMLSAFILGLACGGFWIKRRIDRLTNQVWFLGAVQLMMGLLALATLPLYGHTFGFMSFMVQALSKTDAGYTLFHLSAHAISLFIMLPATFCAGMTLPLLTAILLRTRQGESAIGNVYAANTLGAILGVLVAVHVMLPTVGLKGLIIAGAVLDIGLGWILFGMAAGEGRRQRLLKPIVVGAGALLAVFFGVHLDPHKMASGVYRHGRGHLPQENQILFHQDGKTATVNLTRYKNGQVVISTNGKPDAGIQMVGAESTSDEITMTMAAALALGFNFEAKTAANIGMGSGLTAHVMLTSPYLQRLDTVEIEPAMAAAAQGFRPRVEAVFSDPRSVIHYEDAKTFFSTRKHQYDIIVSEPSNPWVSGVSGLFSQEFYQLVRNYLRPDGVLVQWLQDYEFDGQLFASVINALAQHFSDYAVFNSDNGDVIIVARNNGILGTIDPRLLTHQPMAEELAKVGVKSSQDVEIRQIGSSTLLAPFFSSWRAPANSDYFPFLDLYAVRTRFLSNQSQALSNLGIASLPVLEMLGGSQGWMGKEVTGDSYYQRSKNAVRALAAVNFLNGNTEVTNDALPLAARQQLAMVTLPWRQCATPTTAEVWLESMIAVTQNILPYVPPQTLEPIWAKIEVTPCAQALPQEYRQWLALFKAISNRDGQKMAAVTQKLVSSSTVRSDPERVKYVVGAHLLGLLSQGRTADAKAAWETYRPTVQLSDGRDLYLRLLVAHTQPQRGNSLQVATASASHP